MSPTRQSDSESAALVDEEGAMVSMGHASEGGTSRNVSENKADPLALTLAVQLPGGRLPVRGVSESQKHLLPLILGQLLLR